MSKRMNWRNARLSGLRQLSTRDEEEYRERDAAARWLERKQAGVARKPKHHSSKPGAAS